MVSSLVIGLAIAFFGAAPAVDELLISEALVKGHPQPEEVEAILAPGDPRFAGGTESEEPHQASVPDLLVTKAKQTDRNVYLKTEACARSCDGARKVPAD